MSLGTILLIILIVVLVGALPTWPGSSGWGYYPSGGVGLIVLIPFILLLGTHLASLTRTPSAAPPRQADDFAVVTGSPSGRGKWASPAVRAETSPAAHGATPRPGWRQSVRRRDGDSTHISLRQAVVGPSMPAGLAQIVLQQRVRNGRLETCSRKRMR